MNPTELAKLELEVALSKAQVANAIESLEANLRQLIAHVENLAFHIVAIEAVLKNSGQLQSVDPAAVSDTIRASVAAGTGGSGDPGPALKAMAELLQGPDWMQR